MKEKMLTVLVPIHGDEDFIRQTTQVPTIDNTVENLVYLYNGVYYRRFGDTVVEVTDVEFPRIGHPLELFDFTYSSTRMSTAPTITASTKWYAEEDKNDHLFYNLDGKWTKECHVEFEGQKYFIKEVPTSSKDNEDARYKYDIEFVSHWQCLERVFIYDTVAPYIAERQLNESETFSFFGDITELRKRINASLVRSGLSTYKFRTGVTSYFTYQQWNNIPMGTQSDPSGYYHLYSGNYTAYLQNEVFVYENGEFVIDGYQLVIDEGTVSEEKMIAFDKNYIYDALQKICDKENGYGLSYYYKHGTKEIHIGESEYDFGEDNAVSYGRYRELLSIKKTNNTERVINRMTGKGSEENIPYYYPNPTADGWLKSVYSRVVAAGSMPTVADAQPTDIYPSPEANAYENFLKNRLGNKFEYGVMVDHIHEIGYNPDISKIEIQGESYGGGVYAANRIVAHYYFSTLKRINLNNIYIGSIAQISRAVDLNPCLDFTFNMSKKSKDGEDLQVKAMLRDVTTDALMGTYDSFNYDESTASDFAKMCHHNDHSIVLTLTNSHVYDLSVYVYIDEVPLATRYQYEGYHYPQVVEGLDEDPSKIDHLNVFDEDFYTAAGLKNIGTVITSGLTSIGGKTKRYDILRRCRDNSTSSSIIATSMDPIRKEKGVLYKDLASGVIYKCTRDEMFFPVYYNTNAFTANPKVSLEEWISEYLSLDICIYNVDGWYRNGKKVNLEDYGLTVTGTPKILDTITFKRVKYITPQQRLMPEIYIKTDGERRFYNALNYPFESDTADTDSGEYIDGSDVENDLYKNNDGDYRVFENPYTPQLVSEDIREYDDIKPSIKGMTNTVDGQTFRIDVAAEYAYDELDDDSVWENESDGNIEGDYKHPHFFIKLRQLPFNIFDLALTEDMEIALTSGKCGSCKFKIKVDENTKKNPVQVWEYDVYIKRPISSETLKPYIIYAHAGSLQRYTTQKLYKREQRSYIDESGDEPVTRYFYEYVEIDMHWSSMYTTEAIKEGFVGVLNTENHTYMEGDVVTRGVFQSVQQDTSAGEVWLALEKDTDTFGMLMPAARPTYNDETYSIYIRPASLADTGDENTADTFVITNIRMPQYYLRFAERELSKQIIADMEKDNAQRFNFSMYFSRIFLSESELFRQNLTENAVLYCEYDNKKYKQYIQSYTYKMTASETLPDISVDMNDELSVVYGGFTERIIGNVSTAVSRDITNHVISAVDSDFKKRYVSKKGTAIVSGNIVSRQTDSSIAEERISVSRNKSSIYDLNLNVSSGNVTNQTFRTTADAELKALGTRDKVVSLKVNELVERANDNTLRLVSLSGAINTYNTGKEREKEDMIEWSQCIIDGQIVPEPEDVDQCKIVNDIENLEIITD